MLNGLLLIVSYFLARIVFGFYHTYYIFWPDAFSLLNSQPPIDMMTRVRSVCNRVPFPVD